MWTAAAGPALATCALLMQSVTLAQTGFSDQKPRNPIALERLSATISAIDSMEMLLLLQRSGQAAAFGNLRNLLTQVDVIARSPEGLTYMLPEQMVDNLKTVKQIIDNACLDGDGNLILMSESAGDLPVEGTNKGQSKALQLAQWLSERGVLSEDQIAFLRQGYNLRDLGRFILTVGAAITLAILLHYGVLILRVLRRNRRICDVPASLNYMTNDIDGAVTILGRFGCAFRPGSKADLQPVVGAHAGDYCTITLNGAEIGAKLLYDVSNDVRLLFSSPLDPKTLTQILSQSRIPVRYDFAVVTPRATKRRVFGLGGLPKT